MPGSPQDGLEGALGVPGRKVLLIVVGCPLSWDLHQLRGLLSDGAFNLASRPADTL